jgi:hypothetical protein
LLQHELENENGVRITRASASRGRGDRTSDAMADEIAEQETELSTFNAQHITLNVQSEFSELSVVACKLNVGRFLRLE